MAPRCSDPDIDATLQLVAGRRKWWRQSEAERAWESHVLAQRQERNQARAALLQSLDEEARRLAGAGVVLPPLHANTLLRGMVGHYRGRLAEERIVRILNEWPDRPCWLLEARRAPEDLDQLGVDVLVSTADLGTLALQVKSCRESAQKYRRGHAEVAELVGVVVVPMETPDADAWAVVMTELERLRAMARAPQEKPTEGAA
jgi:hypothetical protein